MMLESLIQFVLVAASAWQGAIAHGLGEPSLFVSKLYLEELRDDGQVFVHLGPEWADPSYNTSAYTCADFNPLAKGQMNIAEFRCKSGKCILVKGFCNGVPNCDDGSDEVNCTELASRASTSSAPADKPEGSIHHASAEHTVAVKTAMAERSGAKTAPAKTTGGSACFHHDVSFIVLDMINGQYRPFVYVNSAAQCQYRCALMSGCTHFAFGALDHGCHLVGSVSPMATPLAGFITGPRSCKSGDAEEKFLVRTDSSMDAIGLPPSIVFMAMTAFGLVGSVSICVALRWVFRGSSSPPLLRLPPDEKRPLPLTE